MYGKLFFNPSYRTAMQKDGSLPNQVETIVLVIGNAKVSA